MRLLELFSGTGSVSKAIHKEFKETEIISIDILDKFNPTIRTDILDWDYKIYPPHYFDVIWASPPCTEYSRAKTRSPRNLDLADSIVKRTLEIIDYYKPTTFFIENPHSGLLKSRPFMTGIPYYTVDYCQYGMPYRKRTAIWTNKKDFKPKLCGEKNHLVKLGGASALNISPLDRYRIPEPLIRDLFL